MLTALATEDDRIAGLELGADDYLVKPFSPRELVARVRAILRRAPPADAADALRFEGLELHRREHRALIDGAEVTLTPREWALLETLAAQPFRAFTRAELIERVFGDEAGVLERTVDAHVMNLRRRIETGCGQAGAHRDRVRRRLPLRGRAVRLSLRAQLTLAIVLVTLAVVAFVLASSRRQLVEEFARVDGGNDTSYVATAAAWLEAWYPDVRDFTWPGADSVLATLQRPPGIELVLQSMSGVVVAATRSDLRHAELSGGGNGAAHKPVVLTVRDGSSGALMRLMFDSPPSRQLHGPDGRLVGTVYSFYMPRPRTRPARRCRSRARARRPRVARAAARRRAALHRAVVLCRLAPVGAVAGGHRRDTPAGGRRSRGARDGGGRERGGGSVARVQSHGGVARALRDDAPPDGLGRGARTAHAAHQPALPAGGDAGRARGGRCRGLARAAR